MRMTAQGGDRGGAATLGRTTLSAAVGNVHVRYRFSSVWRWTRPRAQVPARTEASR
jgi:hypothetical protein